MDIKSLRLFQHLANSLHFSQTANAMFVSPPTLTRVIARLEQECNAPLFIRNNRSVALTNAGLRFLEFADTTLNEYAIMKQAVKDKSQTIRGELSMYCSVTASQSYLPAILDKLQQGFPLIDIKLDTGDHALSLDKVASGQADFALSVFTPKFPQHIAFQKIDIVPLTLIVPKNMNVEYWEDVSWSDTSVVMPSRGLSKSIVESWFDNKSIRPRIYAQVSGNEAIVSMVALGLGVGFVPQIVLENSVVSNKVRALTVPDIEPYQLGLCYIKEREQEPLIKTVSQLLVS